MTTVEAMFYMGGSYGKRRVCYIRSNETDMQKLKLVKRDSFAPGLWCGLGLVSMEKPHFELLIKA